MIAMTGKGGGGMRMRTPEVLMARRCLEEYRSANAGSGNIGRWSLRGKGAGRLGGVGFDSRWFAKAHAFMMAHACMNGCACAYGREPA